MKPAVVFVGLSLAVMVVLIYQAMKQEYNLRNLKTRFVEKTADFQRNEASIDELKTKFQIMNKALMTVNINIAELNERKKEFQTVAWNSSQILQTCSKEKKAAENKKAVTREVILKLKADHSVAKEKAERDIQQLKKLILDRDTDICTFADTTKVEARKLCASH